MMAHGENRFSHTRTGEDPCGLYIHTPFCETKCGYCDFYSVALKDRNTAPLVAAVIRELELRLAASALPVCTIFCGGGTPTLLPLEQLERLLKAVRQQIDNRQSTITNPLKEFTVEANPATVDDAKAELLVASDVTRVSMGAQSFFPAELATLERLHSPDDIAPSVQILRRHGVGQVNLDLIFGIPGQTLNTWGESLRRAIDLEPDHIACYGLTYEPATRLTAQRDAGRVTPCDEDLEAEMFVMTGEVLESAGYRQYEISNYAKPGCECKHNLIYWRNQQYIGVGPSAAGCYIGSDEATTRRSDEVKVEKAKRRKGETADAPPGRLGEDLINGHGGRLRRYKNVSDVADYTRRVKRADTGIVHRRVEADVDGAGASPAGLPPAVGSLRLAEVEAEFVEGETLALEMILMQLRLNEGLSIAGFHQRTGTDLLRVFDPVLSKLMAQGLLQLVAGHVALTRGGCLVANRIIEELAACLGNRSMALQIL